MSKLSILLIALMAACATTSKADLAQGVFEEGEKFAGQGKFPEAIERYSRAIEIKPDFELAYYKRGCARLELVTRDQVSDPRQATTEAARDFTESIRYWPMNYDAFYNRAVCHATLATYREAVKDLQAVLRSTDISLLKRAHRKLGIIYEEEYESMAREAVLHYQAYLELGGDDGEIKRRMAALKERADATAKASDSPEAEKIYIRALEAINEGRQEDGMNLLQEIIAKYPESQVAREKALPKVLQYIKSKSKQDKKPDR